jgi:hypothetical protein
LGNSTPSGVVSRVLGMCARSGLGAGMKSRLPTFLGLGSARCASTWMHYVLQSHPQILMTRGKEVSFFGKSCLEMTLEDYASAFEPTAEKADAMLRGDISPRYAMLSRGCIARAQRLLPDARLLLVIRNPVDRAWSHAMMHLSYIEKRALGVLPVAAVLRCIEHARHIHASDYERIIDDWSEAFGPGSLHVELYDRLCSHPADLLRDVLRHIGADSDWQPSAQQLQLRYWSTFEVTGGQVTEGDMPEIVRWYLAMQWREKVRRLNERLDGRVSAWVEEIENVAGKKAPITWQLRGLLNRSLIRWPERIAYGTYDQVRECRLVLAHRRLHREYSEWTGTAGQDRATAAGGAVESVA